MTVSHEFPCAEVLSPYQWSRGSAQKSSPGRGGRTWRLHSPAVRGRAAGGLEGCGAGSPVLPPWPIMAANAVVSALWYTMQPKLFCLAGLLNITKEQHLVLVDAAQLAGGQPSMVCIRASRAQRWPGAAARARGAGGAQRAGTVAADEVAARCALGRAVGAGGGGALGGRAHAWLGCIRQSAAQLALQSRRGGSREGSGGSSYCSQSRVVDKQQSCWHHCRCGPHMPCAQALLRLWGLFSAPRSTHSSPPSCPPSQQATNISISSRRLIAHHINRVEESAPPCQQDLHAAGAGRLNTSQRADAKSGHSQRPLNGSRKVGSGADHAAGQGPLGAGLAVVGEAGGAQGKELELAGVCRNREAQGGEAEGIRPGSVGGLREGQRDGAGQGAGLAACSPASAGSIQGKLFRGRGRGPGQRRGR